MLLEKTTISTELQPHTYSGLALDLEYLTYFQKEKKSKRNFRKAKRNPPAYARYGSYPELFEFEPKTHDTEPIRIGNFKIDLDAAGDIERVVEEAKKIIKHFEEVYKIPVAEWRIWFSGGKGVHLELLASCFYHSLAQGRRDLPLFYKKVATDLVKNLDLKTLDLSIYCMGSGKPFRIENVKRENGNYKVSITYEELDAANHDQFIKEPREVPDNRTGKGSQELYDRFANIGPLNTIYNNTSVTCFDSESLNGEQPPCIDATLENREVTPGKCDFNQSMMTTVRYCLTSGISFEEAMKDAAFSLFVEEFPSGSLGSDQAARRDNVRNRFDSMARYNSEFSCGYAKGLGIKLGCDNCPIHLAGNDNIVTESESQSAAEKYLKKDARRSGSLDIYKLPKKLRDHIQAAMVHADVNPLLLLPGALCSASAAIGKRVQFPWFGTNLLCNLYVLTIANSGDGKSTAMSITARDIRRLHNEWSQAVQDEKNAEEPDQDFIKELYSKLLSIAERLTLEAMVDRLGKHGGTIFTSEFGGFIKGLKGGGNAFGMMEILSDFYDCPDNWQKETVGGGLLTLINPYLSICGFSTLEFLQGELAKDDIGSGALARYLFFYPPTTNVTPPALPSPNRPHISEMKIYEEMTEMDEVIMELSDEAEYRYKEIFDEINADIKGTGDKGVKFLEPFIKRWGANVIKLSMILQQFEKVGSEVIGLKAVEGAWHIVSLAMESTKVLFDSKLGISKHQDQCNRVLGYLARKGGTATRGDVYKGQALGKKVKIKEMDEILESLVHSDEIIFFGKELKNPKTVLMMKENG